MPQPLEILWTPEFEMDHWNGIDRAKHFNELEEKHRILQVASFSPENPRVVVSVGGGRWAGDLRLYTAGRQRVLVDPLVEQFNDVPDEVEKVAAFARAIPMPSNVADVVFCIEALDHCADLEDLEASAVELERITKPGGVIFFQMPVRNLPRLGHPIAKTVIKPEHVCGLFKRSMIKLSELRAYEDGTRVWLTLEKMEAWD